MLPREILPAMCDDALSQCLIQGGQFGVTDPPKRLWRPFDINAPLFGAYRSSNRDKKYST